MLASFSKFDATVSPFYGRNRLDALPRPEPVEGKRAIAAAKRPIALDGLSRDNDGAAGSFTVCDLVLAAPGTPVPHGDVEYGLEDEAITTSLADCGNSSRLA